MVLCKQVACALLMLGMDFKGDSDIVDTDNEHTVYNHLGSRYSNVLLLADNQQLGCCLWQADASGFWAEVVLYWGQSFVKENNGRKKHF